VGTLFNTSIDLDLLEYNRLVMQYQDEVYTLAVDLLGDEAQASEVVQASFMEAFGNTKKAPKNFRQEILSLAIHHCLRQERVLPGPQNLCRYLTHLGNEEKIILILVDSLELSYAEAAAVMKKSMAAIAKTIAQARVSVHFAMVESNDLPLPHQV